MGGYLVGTHSVHVRLGMFATVRLPRSKQMPYRHMAAVTQGVQGMVFIMAGVGMRDMDPWPPE